MISLTDDELKIVQDILQRLVPHCEVRVFGSRYKGTARKYSDLDLVIVGTGKLDWQVLSDLKDAFEESDLPFRVDVLDWYAISSEFRDVINNGYELMLRD